MTNRENSTLKEQALSLFASPEDGDLSYDPIFNRDTFVLLPSDLDLLNTQVNQSITINNLKKTLETEGDVDDDETLDPSYLPTKESFYDDYEDDEDFVDGDDNSILNELTDIQIENAKENQDEIEKRNVNVNVNGNEDFDYDSELDLTQYLYDPPTKYKNKFLMYLIKCSPLILVIIAVMLIMKVIDVNNFQNNVGAINNSSNNFLNHKIYILEQKMEDFKKTDADFKDLLSKFDNLNNQIVQLNNFRNGLEIFDKSANLNVELFEKLNKLENQLDNNKKENENGSGKLSLLNDPEFEQYMNDFKAQIEDNLDEVINRNQNKLTEMINSILDKSSNLNQVQNQSLKPLSPPIIHPIKNKYYNVAEQATIIPNLTTIPKLKRLRKSVLDRILHGFSDWYNRSKAGNHRKIIGINGIELRSRLNSPYNGLIEKPGIFWQTLIEDLPITYAIKFADPIKIKEVGIYHSRLKSLLSPALKMVELFIMPTNNKDYKLLHKKMFKYHNQDFQLNKLTGWVKISELQYDIHSLDQYQKFPISNEQSTILSEFKVNSIMIVISSNWGDEKFVVLDTLRVYSYEDDATITHLNENVVDLGMDLPIV